MANFYEKYVAQCVKKGVSPTAAAVACGFSKAAPNGWKKRDRNPTEFTIKRLADYFGCKVEDLSGDPEPEDVSPVISVEMKNSIADNGNGLNLIPLLGTVAAGIPMYADENIQGYVPCTKNVDGLYALMVHGDSMDRDGIKDGDTVIVHKQNTVDKGEIAVVSIDGDEATIKRIILKGSVVVLMPNSTNPANQPQIYSMMEHRIEVIGKVVQCMHDFT